jgi:hypothetical protein
MTIFEKCLFVFIAMFVADLCWAFYIVKVENKQAGKASFWSVALFLAGAAGTINYVNNPYLLIPACLGVAYGTYVAIKIEVYRKYNKASEVLKAAIPLVENNNYYGCIAIKHAPIQGDKYGFQKARQRAQEYFNEFKPIGKDEDGAWWTENDPARIVALENALAVALECGD